MKRWQAVVFDLDDTLYPEREYVLSGFRAVAEWGATAFGIDAMTGYTQLQTLFDAGVRGDTFNRWLKNNDIIQQDDEPKAIKIVIEPLLEVYRQHLPSIQPFPEAVALISELTEQYQLGLVSDGYLAVQQRKWAALNLAHYFHGVVFSDKWGRSAWKPSTEPFVEVLHLLNTAPEQAVYIGDNPLKDFLGARQVGMATIWLKHEYGEYVSEEPPTTAHAPDRILTSWESLQRELLPSKV